MIVHKPRKNKGKEVSQYLNDSNKRMTKGKNSKGKVNLGSISNMLVNLEESSLGKSKDQFI